MIKIYGSHTPMFLKVILAAEELKLPYEVQLVDIMKGEQKSPDHLARHPFGKIPAIEHHGRFLFESNAIIRYLGTLASSQVYPSESWDRAEVDQWIDYFSLQAGRWCTSAWFEANLKPTFLGSPTDEKRVAEFTEMLLEGMPTIDSHLSKSRYLAGNIFTLADVNAFMLMRGFREAKLNLNDFPNVIKWHDEIVDRPTVKKVFAAWW